MSIQHRYVVMAATDTADWRASDGPIVFETIGDQLCLSRALDRMDRTGHGARQLCRLTYVDRAGMREDGAEAAVGRAIAAMKAALTAMLAANATAASVAALGEAAHQIRASIKELEAIDV